MVLSVAATIQTPAAESPSALVVLRSWPRAHLLPRQTAGLSKAWRAWASDGLPLVLRQANPRYRIGVCTASPEWQRVPSRSVEVVPAQTLDELRQVEPELVAAAELVTQLTFAAASSRETGKPPGRPSFLRGVTFYRRRHSRSLTARCGSSTGKEHTPVAGRMAA